MAIAALDDAVLDYVAGASVQRDTVFDIVSYGESAYLHKRGPDVNAGCQPGLACSLRQRSVKNWSWAAGPGFDTSS